eukprot:a342858_115.p1 GENE.a342858_115~~a342858_115.p1  ORF type:complete len:200 (+),score=81.18 a342858_115:43-600(+)
MSRQNLQELGQAQFAKMEHVSGELFALTYGAIVSQLLEDFEDYAEVNLQLDKMGFSIGQRLVEEFLALSHIGRCASFRDSAETIALVGFKMYLGVTASVTWANDKDCRLTLQANPLAEFVELPPDAMRKLFYSNVLCGVLRGALEMLGIVVTCEFVSDTLFNDAATEIRIIHRETIVDRPPNDED